MPAADRCVSCGGLQCPGNVLPDVQVEFGRAECPSYWCEPTRSAVVVLDGWAVRFEMDGEPDLARVRFTLGRVGWALPVRVDTFRLSHRCEWRSRVLPMLRAPVVELRLSDEWSYQVSRRVVRGVSR